MGNVDQADHLRLQYRIHYWLRNREWWWAIFFWAFECSLTNAYILFRKFFKIHEREPPFSHYEFVKKVALAWLKPNEFWPSIKSKKSIPCDNSSTIKWSIASSIVAKRRIKFVQRKKSTITDKALDPYIGNLRCRLDTSLNHLPEKKNKPDNNCQLHYWFNKTKCRAQLMRCTVQYIRTVGIELLKCDKRKLNWNMTKISKYNSVLQSPFQHTFVIFVDIFFIWYLNLGYF